MRFTLTTLENTVEIVGSLLAGRPLAHPIPAQHTEIRSPPSAPAASSTAACTALLVGHVRLYEHGAVPELPGQRHAVVGIQVGDHDARAGAVEPARGGGAEPGRASGDERA